MVVRATRVLKISFKEPPSQGPCRVVMTTGRWVPQSCSTPTAGWAWGTHSGFRLAARLQPPPSDFPHQTLPALGFHPCESLSTPKSIKAQVPSAKDAKRSKYRRRKCRLDARLRYRLCRCAGVVRACVWILVTGCLIITANAANVKC